MGNQNGKAGDVRVGIDDFEIISLLGKGGFGKVWKVQEKSSGEIFAMKVLTKKAILEQNLVEHTTLERDIMCQLREQPFIVGMHYAFQTDEKLFFILDYMSGGSLFYHLKATGGPFPEPIALFYMSEMLLAIEALHSNDIVYRDLKLENILLDAEGHLRLTDFGLSAKMAPNRRIHSYSGSPAYMAPEILTDEGEGHDKSVDLWALGICFHLMLTAKVPFWGDNFKTLFDNIKYEKLKLESFPLSADAASLLRGLLSRDVKQRLGCGASGIAQVKRHPFFKNVNWEDALQKKLVPPIIPNFDESKQYEIGQVPTAEDSITSEQARAARKKAKVKAEMKFKRFTYIAGKPPRPPRPPRAPGASGASLSSSAGTSSPTGSSSNSPLTSSSASPSTASPTTSAAGSPAVPRAVPPTPPPQSRKPTNVASSFGAAPPPPPREATSSPTPGLFPHKPRQPIIRAPIFGAPPTH